MQFADYKPKTPTGAPGPWFDHQHDHLFMPLVDPAYPKFFGDACRGKVGADLPLYALLWEQRTGKTKPVFDTACYRYEKGDIDTLVVVAWPLGVHRNWLMDDAPAYIPDRIRWDGVVWDSARSNLVSYKRNLADLMLFKGLRIITVAAESIITKAARTYLKDLIDASRGTMVVADEFSFMESHDAERTLVMQRIALHKKVTVKRILDGTPVGNRGPLGLFSPFLFLNPRILGHTQFITYKLHFAEWEKKDFRDRLIKEREMAAFVEKTMPQIYKAYPGIDDREFARVLNEKKEVFLASGRGSLIQKRDKSGIAIYKNLDELEARLAPWSSRVLRAQVFPHLKVPLYQTAYVELTKEQRRVYDELKEEYKAELRTGTDIEAEHVLTRYLRLQQIASNYYPEHDALKICPACQGEGCELCDDLGMLMGTLPAVRIDPDRNPRMERLTHEMGRTSDAMLIGAKFRQDAADILEAAREAGFKVARYWGNLAAKTEAKRAFQAGDVQFLVGNQFSLSRGHKLTAARTILFYSHDFALRTRLQFQDRAIVSDMRHQLEIVDIVAQDTVDQKIVASLRANKNIADMITGDPKGDWI